MAKYLQFLIPSLTVAYPIINDQDYSMEFYQATEELTLNKWGIHEPMPVNPIQLNELDTFLVPLIGFDNNGHRIGYGKGYYDRYFARLDHYVKRIGISYFEPIENVEDTHQFDVPLTHCITPNRIYEF